MTPILPSVPGYKLWMIWLAIIVAVLVAKPWGMFGWDEWLVLAAPLLLLHPAVPRIGVLIAGLAASGLAWFFLGEQSGGWQELVCIWAVLVAGTVIGFAAIRSNNDGHFQPGGLDWLSNEDLFFDSLNRELCRARRSEESFAVLSLDRKTEHSDSSLSGVCEFLDTELRAYADIVQAGDRVLALVPEVEDSQYEPLLKRLTVASEATQSGEIRIGMSRFPGEAIYTEDLIDLADRKRLVRGVSSTPSAGQIQAGGQVPS